jgi:hypothetical protein
LLEAFLNNFLLDQQGVIVAKNISKKELEEFLLAKTEDNSNKDYYL